ncbi:hypothetical protein [Pelagibacterium montanilacus]|uniref:hypothetical protein n=1 Tax=Pelagibacterium montanilacus TaxID=2185280 RepID=UPI000F8DA3B9|nr:hypothetical protein [Pelagibacterium montanilacus]
MTTPMSAPWQANRWRPFVWTGLVVLLAVPLIAMQFTSEVDWDIFDFLFAAILLATVGIAFEFSARMKSGLRPKLAAMALVIGLVLIIWAHAAVGIV